MEHQWTNSLILQQVIEYLNKKGYVRTEATLRSEGANQDAEGNIVHARLEDRGGIKYRISLGRLTDIRDKS